MTVVLSTAGVIVRNHAAARQQEQIEPVTAPSATPVRVVKLERRVLHPQARFHGFLAPFNTLTAAARIPGEIVDQRADVSDPIGEGDLLFKIDDTIRMIEHEQAQSANQKARSEYELARARWEQMASLSEESSSSVERVEALTRLQAAEAAYAGAKAEVRRAAVYLEWTEVKAPIRGVVSRIHARRGESVQQGQPLAEVIEVDRLKLLAQIEERHIAWIRPGHEVDLTSDALPGEIFVGTVYRVHPQALPTSRMFEVEIELPNPAGSLRPGFFMTGTVETTSGDAAAAEPAGVLLVPREAVVEQFGQHVCYVLHGAEVGHPGGNLREVRQTTVQVLPVPADPRSYQVVRGVSEGDLVVTKGLQHLADRAFVRIEE